MADLALLARPEALDAAALALLAPFLGRPVASVIERGRELVAAVPAAFGELVIARQLQADPLHGHGGTVLLIAFAYPYGYRPHSPLIMINTSLTRRAARQSQARIIEAARRNARHLGRKPGT